MRINLKALGLALVAAFAMSAVAASTAAAAGPGLLTTPFGESVTLTGEDDGVNAFTSFEGKVECPESTYTGHKVLTHEETTVEEKSHELLPNKSTQVTVTPHYKQVNEGTANCDVNEGEFSATVFMNGCDYRFYDFTTTGEPGTYGFTIEVVCPPEKEIELKSYAGHLHGFQVCNTKIGPQKELTGAHATNEESAGKHTITLTGTVHSIKATKEGLCGGGETAEGEYHINVKIKAHNGEGEPTEGVTISHTR